MTDTVLARLAEIKTMAIPDLRASWRELFATEPPPYNRKFLESRPAYRIQELAYGGLKPQMIERLKALGEQLDGGNIAVRRIRGDNRPAGSTPDPQATSAGVEAFEAAADEARILVMGP